MISFFKFFRLGFFGGLLLFVFAWHTSLFILFTNSADSSEVVEFLLCFSDSGMLIDLL